MRSNVALCQSDKKPQIIRNVPRYSGFRVSEYGPRATSSSLLRPPIEAAAQTRSRTPAVNRMNPVTVNNQ